MAHKKRVVSGVKAADSAQSVAGESPAPGEQTPPRDRRVANFILAGLCVYALVLAVLTADQIFGLGLYPPKLDRMIMDHLDHLADPDMPKEERENTEEWLISYHEFAVPHLLKALRGGKPMVTQSATRCLQDIALKFFEPHDPRNPSEPTLQARRKIASFGADPVLWEGWWIETRNRLEEAVPR